MRQYPAIPRQTGRVVGLELKSSNCLSTTKHKSLYFLYSNRLLLCCNAGGHPQPSGAGGKQSRPSQRRRLLSPGAWEWAALGFCGRSTAVQRRVELGKQGHREQSHWGFFFSFCSVCAAGGRRAAELEAPVVSAGETLRTLHRWHLDAVSPAARPKGENCKLLQSVAQMFVLAAGCLLPYHVPPLICIHSVCQCLAVQGSALVSWTFVV